MKGSLLLVLGNSELFGGNYFKWLVMLVLMVLVDAVCSDGIWHLPVVCRFQLVVARKI